MQDMRLFQWYLLLSVSLFIGVVTNLKNYTWRSDSSKIEIIDENHFTENVTARKLIIKPFVKSFLKKQQELYVTD